jgi:hypothetical protein
MHGVVERHCAWVKLAALEARPSAEHERQVWRDGEDRELPPTAVLSHYDSYGQSDGEQPHDQISQSFQPLMQSSRQSYISALI